MIKFLTLKIKNFKAIKEAELTYDQGVWLVQGINNDAVFDSNGSGKTTAMEAIQQCLFNKTTSPVPIEDTYRKTEGVKAHTRKYFLEVTFLKGKDRFVISNDRTKMSIQILKNGKDMMFKSIPQSLKFIQLTLGMDFNTFITLTFINHMTITELLDNFSSSSLMKVVLNFSQIASFEKSAKVEQKALNASIHSLQSQIQTISDSLEALSIYKEEDLGPLNIQKVSRLAEETDFYTKFNPLLAATKKEAKGCDDYCLEVLATIRSIAHLLQDSKCECCGALHDITELDRDNLNAELADSETQLELAEQRLAVANDNYDEVSAEYTRGANLHRSNLQDINDKITAARTRNALYQQTKDKTDHFRKQLAELTKEQDELQVELSVIIAALETLKSGDIQKSLLGTFTVLLNNHIVKFLDYVSLDYITIAAEANKAAVSFKIQDSRFNQAISIHTLSGGEKTRLRLVVLLAMLYTIQDLAQVATNLLFFDESLDTLDGSAQEDLSRLFDYLTSKSGKFIAMVSHGGQLDSINFAGTILATKTEGVSVISKEVS